MVFSLRALIMGEVVIEVSGAVDAHVRSAFILKFALIIINSCVLEGLFSCRERRNLRVCLQRVWGKNFLPQKKQKSEI
jgi:hypothetical protein